MVAAGSWRRRACLHLNHCSSSHRVQNRMRLGHLVFPVGTDREVADRGEHGLLAALPAVPPDALAAGNGERWL